MYATFNTKEIQQEKKTSIVLSCHCPLMPTERWKKGKNKAFEWLGCMVTILCLMAIGKQKVLCRKKDDEWIEMYENNIHYFKKKKNWTNP